MNFMKRGMKVMPLHILTTRHIDNTKVSGVPVHFSASVRKIKTRQQILYLAFMDYYYFFFF